MEITQLEQMIRWLDEERKRDKTTIAALQERLEQQIGDLAARVEQGDRVRLETRFHLNRGQQNRIGAHGCGGEVVGPWHPTRRRIERGADYALGGRLNRDLTADTPLE